MFLLINSPGLQQTAKVITVWRGSEVDKHEGILQSLLMDFIKLSEDILEYKKYDLWLCPALLTIRAAVHERRKTTL